MPLSERPNPFGQLPVMAGDAAGLNPANGTRYFFGLDVNIDPVTSNTPHPHVLSAPAILTGFSIIVTVAGTVDTAANNVAVSIRVNATTDYGTSNVTLQSLNQTVNSPVLSVPLNKGDSLQVTFLTPTFTTLPTLVFFNGGIQLQAIG